MLKEQQSQRAYKHSIQRDSNTYVNNVFRSKEVSEGRLSKQQ